MKKLIFLAFSFLSVFLLCGCSAHRFYRYPPKDGGEMRIVSILNKTNYSVVIREFIDDREDYVWGVSKINTIPEMDRFYHVDVVKHYGESVRLSLLKSGLFKSVLMEYEPRELQYDFVLTGRILNTDYDVSYSILGCCGGFFIGFPAAKITSRLQVELVLTNVFGEEVWRKTIDKQGTISINPVWYNQTSEYDAYPKFLLEGMNEAIDSLVSEMRNHPEKFSYAK